MATYRGYHSKIDEAVPLTRRCDRCGSIFHHIRKIKIGSKSSLFNPAGGANTAAQATASVNLRFSQLKSYLSSRYGSQTFGAYCPHCRDFTPAAYDTHFPNGLKRGFMSKLHLAIRGDRFSQVANLCMVLLILLMVWIGFLHLSGQLKPTISGSVLFAPPIVMLILGLLTRTIWHYFGVRKVEARLSELTEDQLRSWILEIYIQSRENLELPALFLPSQLTCVKFNHRFGYLSNVGECPGQYVSKPKALPSSVFSRVLKSLSKVQTSGRGLASTQ